MAKSIQNATDAELIEIATQCISAMDANLGDYPGVPEQMVDDIKIARDEFSPEVILHVAKRAEAKAQTQVKDAKRVPLETRLATAKNVTKPSGTERYIHEFFIKEMFGPDNLAVLSLHGGPANPGPAWSPSRADKIPMKTLQAAAHIWWIALFEHVMIFRKLTPPAKRPITCSAGACPTAQQAPGAKP